MFWGEPTSTVDWCEANYLVTPYVAEFWNTLSSFAMVVVGVLGAASAWRAPGRSTRTAFVLLAVVGLGSIAFHGTLRFETQMLDELPMVYLVLFIASWLLGHRWPRAFIAYGVFLTALVTLFRGKTQFALFHASFGSLELFALLRTWWLQRTSPSPIRVNFRRGIVLYVIAVTAWFIDTSSCYAVLRWSMLHGIANPQLHAWWHVLVSLGFGALVPVVAAIAPNARATTPT